MKSFFLTIALTFACITLQAQGLEGMIGMYENNAGYNHENNVREEGLGGQAGVYYINDYEGAFYASSLASIKTNGDLSFTNLVHFNLLWFFEPISEIFVGNQNDENISVLIGSGLMFSTMFYNHLEVPFDIRYNMKFQRFRMQFGFEWYLMERSHYEHNHEFYIKFYHTFFFYDDSQNQSPKQYVRF